jgi:flagellar biosynthesis protein FlhF
MTINRYKANNLKSAIDKATSEMGPDAKILHVRKLDESTGGKSSEMVEIIAVVDEDLEIYNDRNILFDNARQKSIDVVVNDDLKHSDIHKFDVADKNVSKMSDKRNKIHISKLDSTQIKDPIPLSEVLKTYSNQINSESEKKLAKRLNKNEENTESINRENNKYNEKSKLINSFIEESIKKSNKEIEWKCLFESKQQSKTNKRRISQTLHECLVRNQVNNDLAYEILSMLNHDEYNSTFDVRNYLLDFFRNYLDISDENDISKKVTVLIGPTGVGKTTTLAKLAAQYHFQKEKRVGLITIDAYRIAAVEQLKTYAQIMSIPLKVALTPDQLWKCIDDYRDKDVILVDTPGRSHLNMREIRVIEDFLEASQPADIQLLLSASTKDNDAYSVVESFAPDYVQKYIFTKLDETSSFGLILNVCSKIKKPISYFTVGQNVPEDIKLADLEYLGDLFVARRRFAK